MPGRSKRISKSKKTVTFSDSADSNNHVFESPRKILEHCGNTQLAEDAAHLSDSPFLASACSHMHHGTSSGVDSMTAFALEARIISVIKNYAIRAFSVGEVLLGIQLKRAKNINHLEMSVFITRKVEHVKRIECFHRVIEERARLCHVILTFNSIPRTLVAYLMIAIVFCISDFSRMSRASKALHPFAIAEGTVLDYNLNFRVMLGEFAQACKGSLNDVTHRRADALELGLNVNL